MRLLFNILLMLLLAIALGHWLESGDNSVAFIVDDHVVSMEKVFFVAVGAVVLAVFYFSLRTLDKLLRLPKELRRAQRQRRLYRAERHLTRGLTNMTEGAWASAERAFRRAAKCSDTPHINYLLAARAAEQQGARERRDKYIRQAQQHEADNSLLAGLTQAELQLSDQQEKQALATLSRLQARQPGQRQLTEMLVETHARLGNWGAVLSLLGKQGRTRRKAMQHRLEDAWTGLLSDAAGHEALNKVWHDMPRALRKRARLIDAYINQCLRLDAPVAGEPLLRAALKRSWDQGLVRLYGLINTEDEARQLAWLEGFVRDHQGDPVLLLSLGRLAARNELWDRAKTYFQNSIAAGGGPEACYELAGLHRREGDNDAATRSLQQGLELVVGRPKYPAALPDAEALADREGARVRGARQVL